ncbi:MAG: MDR/SDR family oxidoreductase, partial [Chitinophagaceae bacterium]|nr:MDR/SDR family oxidoreductase [Chitinophagaceae bacterium]
PLWLLLDTPENPALTGALEGFAKAAALEQGQRQWLRIHLLAPGVAANLPWEQIGALAPAELALGWDGRQLHRQRLRPLPPERFRFATRSVGLLESLEPAPLAAAASGPGPGEVELAVEATGLNFRDVLNALGLLRAYSRQLGLDEAAQVPFGGECVGTVTAVGAGVDPQLIGRRLLAALAVGSLASHVTTRAELCVPLPPSLSAAEGASVSTAFLTAIYGLQTLAGLKPGETVLIHAAAGGVGQAALQVARRAGARVLATASAPKQQALLEQGVEAVFDSRSLAFADQVRAHTGGRGVDVVLNSLKGDWVDASFEALAEGGRFVELGKIEIWSRAEAASRRPDATYLPFDLLEVAAADPRLVRGLLEQLLADLEAGRYQLLPIQPFAISQTVDAFRLMAQARHIGKVVITNPEATTAIQNSAVQQPRTSLDPITPEATYLITGALGGLGLQLCKWLADQGATSLLLVARSAANPSEQAQQVLSDLKERGVTCTLIACDLAATGAAAAQQEQALAAALAAVEPGKPLRGVFHAAGVLDDGLLPSQTPERLAAVLAPKLGGWHLLERAIGSVLTSAAQPGSHPFVVQFSSMAALLGSPGQSTYCAANAALDALATAAAGATTPFVGPQLSVQWGPWAGDGMAGALGDRDRQRFAALGVHLLPPDGAFEALGMLLRRGITGAVGVLDLDWPRLAAQANPRQAALLEPLVARAQSRAAAGSGT